MRSSLLLLALLTAIPAPAADVEFKELFADPARRSEALGKLVPGTRDAFFYRALHQQLTGDAQGFSSTMRDWKEAAADTRRGVSLRGWEELDNRRILLGYTADPQSSVKELIRKLDLKFDDVRPAPDAAASLPDRLDPALVTDEAFREAAAKESPGEPWRHYGQKAMLAELKRLDELSAGEIQWIYRHLTTARSPQAVKLLTRIYGGENPPSFSERGALERDLSHDQLDELIRAVPDLKGSLSVAATWVDTLPTRAQADALHPAALTEHLAACCKYLMAVPESADPSLESVFNSLKAAVFYHHLRLQREQGSYPLDVFLAYLRLPRSNNDLLPAAKDPEHPVDLSLDWKNALGCPPVKDDSGLIAALLEHFLAQPEAAAEFKGLIEPSRLARLTARAHLLAGDPAEKWSKGLLPAEVEDLQREIRVAFAPGRPVLLNANDPVSLKLDLKNTPALSVRVFEIDVPELARQDRLDELKVGMDIDGLLPRLEKKFAYTQPPLSIHRETVDLPELSGAGAWLVECVSGNSACRALIRKGALLPVARSAADGRTIRVFDERGDLVQGATAYLDGKEFHAGSDGIIHTPDKPDHSSSGYVQAGKLAAVVDLTSTNPANGAEPELLGTIHVDREQLLPDHRAVMLLKPELFVHSAPAPLEKLEQARIELQFTLRNGNRITRILLQEGKLQPSMEIPFDVPEGTAEVGVKISGSYAADSTVPAQTVYNTQSWVIGERATEDTPAAASRHPLAVRFSRSTEGFFLEMRGRNGEPAASRPLTLSFIHADYAAKVETQVRTDAQGRVSLGDLPGIRLVSASGPDISPTELNTADGRPEVHLRDEMRISSNDEIRLPWPDVTDLDAPLSLVGIDSDDQIFSDRTDLLKHENNVLTIRPLPEGTWRLSLNPPLTIHAVNAPARAGELVTRSEAISYENPAPPVITAATSTGGELLIQLNSPAPGTRLTLIGRRYLWDRAYGSPAETKPSESTTTTFDPTPCEYLRDRRLSDESRYVMDRRAEHAFPGLLLPRGGLLIDRWSREDAKQEMQTGADSIAGILEGDSLKPAPSVATASASASADPFAPGGISPTMTDASAAPDYLARTSTVLYEREPAADGSFRLPLKELAGAQFIEVIATNAGGSHHLIVPLPASEPELRDQRLSHPLDAEKNYVGVRTSTLLTAGRELTASGVLESGWTSFSSLQEAFGLLEGLAEDSGLEEFAPLTRWNRLSEKDKLAFLSDYGCHEVHLFLARKDRPFFDQFVRPRLLEKQEPDVIDDLLLGRDLSRYFRPSAWMRLNAAEKALLSQSSPDARTRVIADLEPRWEEEAPEPEQEAQTFDLTLAGSIDHSSDPFAGSPEDEGALIIKKLRELKIPAISFENISLAAALDLLQAKAHELEPEALKNVKFGIPAEEYAPSLRNLIIRKINLHDISLADTLSVLCEATTTRWRVDEHGVSILPTSESSEEITTRVFTLNAEKLEELENLSPAELRKEMEDHGISFPAGADIELHDGALVVKNTTSNLGLIGLFFGTQKAAETNATDIVTGGLRSGSGTIIRNNIDAVLNNPGSNYAGRTGRPQWEAERDKTQIWQEHRYYKHSGPRDESFIPLNGFWMDLAKWNGEGSFLSPHFNECTHNANEALLALALLDLPFDAPQPETRIEKGVLHIKASTPALVYARETREAGSPEADASVLIRQTFHPLNEAFRKEGGRQVENTVTGNFVAGVPYGMTLVVTNPEGSDRRLDLLAQIPAGAIPLMSQPSTLSISRKIVAYGVINEELAFYFPQAGSYPVYPLHVTDGEKLLAVASRRTLTVAPGAAPEDARSWNALARDATPDTVLDYLRHANLHRLDLEGMLWRLHDRAFFSQVMDIFRDRMFSSPEVEKYALLHADPAQIRAALEDGNLAGEVGPWLDSPLLQVRRDPNDEDVIRDFDPLVNPRVHAFGEYPRLSHPAALSAYEALLDRLAWKPAPDDNDRLALCLALLTQDRVNEGLKLFEQIDASRLSTHLQYDYLRAMVHFYRNEPEPAREIAQQHLNGPREQWAKRFQAVIEQADEIERLKKEGGQTGNSASDGEQVEDLELSMGADQQLLIRSEGIKETDLRFYRVDLETMFSKNPLLSVGDGKLPQVTPDAIQHITLDPSGRTAVEIPERFRDGRVMIAASAGTANVIQLPESPALTVTRQAPQRTLQVLDSTTRQPLPATYVKVYSIDEEGAASFHKDGYTDLRGKFDYLTDTRGDFPKAARLAILIVHPEKGARIEVIENP